VREGRTLVEGTKPHCVYRACHAHYEIEAALVERARERCVDDKFDACRKTYGSRGITVESDCRQGALAPCHLDQLPGESPATAAEFENALPRQQVHDVSESLRPPQHAVIDNRVSPPPVDLAHPFAERQRASQPLC